MIGYKDCYVAFIDILGFKNLLRNADFRMIKEVFDGLISFQPAPLIGNKGRHVYDKIRYYIMSDSIVVYVETGYKGSFIALTDVCLQIQIKLSNNNPPILVRGGISRGLLYHEGNVIFGPGLSAAYSLENELANYPRIVFVSDIRDKAIDNMGRLFVFDYTPLFYKKDSDKLFYIDYMNTYAYIPSIEAKNVEDVSYFEKNYFEGLYDYVISVLASETNPSIREKYLWLLNKIESAIETKPLVKEYFDLQKKKLKIERDNLFDMALS